MEREMNCPFCAKEISAHSLACPFCTRDVSFLAIKNLATNLDKALSRIGILEAEVSEIKSICQHGRHLHETNTKGVASARNFGWLGLSVVFLVISHFIIVGMLDLDTRILRITSIIIPIPFAVRFSQSASTAMWSAISVSMIAVFGMLFSTSIIDNVSMIPQNQAEWVEVCQYFFSIFLSFSAGSLLRWYIQARRHPSATSKSISRGLATAMAGTSTPPNETRAALQQRIATIAGWINAVAVGTTAAGAVIAAVSKFTS